MNNHNIINLPNPAGMNHATTLGYIHGNYLGLHGQQKMLGNLDMNNNRIYNLSLPTGQINQQHWLSQTSSISTLMERPKWGET